MNISLMHVCYIYEVNELVPEHNVNAERCVRLRSNPYTSLNCWLKSTESKHTQKAPTEKGKVSASSTLTTMIYTQKFGTRFANSAEKIASIISAELFGRVLFILHIILRQLYSVRQLTSYINSRDRCVFGSGCWTHHTFGSFISRNVTFSSPSVAY